MWLAAAPAAAAMSLALHACGDSSGAGSLPSDSYDAGVFVDAPAARADAGSAVPPPELEERRAFQTPQAGGRYVYVANPTRDTVAVIDSSTLAIQSVETGDGPTHLVTVPGQDIALVINVNSHTLSVLRTTASGPPAAASGVVCRTTVP